MSEAPRSWQERLQIALAEAGQMNETPASFIGPAGVYRLDSGPSEPAKAATPKEYYERGRERALQAAHADVCDAVGISAGASVEDALACVRERVAGSTGGSPWRMFAVVEAISNDGRPPRWQPLPWEGRPSVFFSRERAEEEAKRVRDRMRSVSRLPDPSSYKNNDGDDFGVKVVPFNGFLVGLPEAQS